MKLYIEIDSKDKNGICGSIYNRVRDAKKEIYLYFDASRIDEKSYWLKVKNYKAKVEEDIIMYEEKMGKMNGKNILYFVENFMRFM